MSGSALRLEEVSFGFGSRPVLTGISLDVNPGEFLAVVGPSGCGKTTLINLLSGRYPPTSGRVTRGGRTRTVYQQNGLFPWLTVGQNIALGLREVRDRATHERELKELLTLIHLQDFLNYYPHQISNGMRQRVELARAVAGHSEILLMDEPFSALDYITRLQMRSELVDILSRRPRSVIFVTHDIEEAVQLANRVVILAGTPARVVEDLAIALDRPRPMNHPVVTESMHRIFQRLGFQRESSFLAGDAGGVRAASEG